MINFLSEFDVTLDSKGRFLLPANFRKQLPEGMGDKFVITRGFDKCLLLYPANIWTKISANISVMNDMLADVRNFKRLFQSPASPVEVDNADRVMIPKNLLEKIGLTKEMMMVPAGNKMELWDKDTYKEYQKQWDDGTYEEAEGGLSKLANAIAEKHGNPFEIKDDE